MAQFSPLNGRNRSLGSPAISAAIVRILQRIINDLHKESLVAFEVNPHHRRAQLVVLTDKGKRGLEAAMELQAPWVNGLSDGLSVKEIETAPPRDHSVAKKTGGKR